MFAVGIVGVLWLVNRKQYRMERFTSFFHPFADMHGVTQQAGHSLWALAGGGWWGRGLGNSQEKWHYLPLSYNDFIFAIIGEELGVVGCFVVIGLFAVLLYAGLRIATRVEDPFRRLVAASCTLWLVGQALINMGAVANLLPITGVPLPLISAGGSSLVITMFMIGMLGSFARAEPDAAVALHARGRTWWARMWGIPLPPLPKGRAAARPPRQRATAGRRRVGQLAEEEVSR
jgi:cell division protein FtsW